MHLMSRRRSQYDQLVHLIWEDEGLCTAPGEAEESVKVALSAFVSSTNTTTTPTPLSKKTA